MAKPGPVPIYTQELSDAILERISAGESMRTISKTKGMPSRATVIHWVAQDVDGFAERWRLAREMQSHSLAEDIIDIADDNGEDAVNPQKVNRDRLRVDARKWIASKLFPRMYGDKVVGEITGRNGAAIAITVDQTPIHDVLQAMLEASKPKAVVIDAEVVDLGQTSTAAKQRFDD